MVTLEQIKLLETKILKALDTINVLSSEKEQLKTEITDYQKRIDELEVLIQRIKDEQGKIEEVVDSALNKLNQFETSRARPAEESQAETIALEAESRVSALEVEVPPAPEGVSDELQGKNQDNPGFNPTVGWGEEAENSEEVSYGAENGYKAPEENDGYPEEEALDKPKSEEINSASELDIF